MKTIYRPSIFLFLLLAFFCSISCDNSNPVEGNDGLTKAQEVPDNKERNLENFQKELSAWTMNSIKTINSIEGQDTLFYFTEYRNQLRLLSNNYSTNDPLIGQIIYQLQDATKLIEPGDLLSSLITETTRKLDSLAQGKYPKIDERWMQEKFSFSLKFESELKAVYEKIKVNSNFDTYQVKIEPWLRNTNSLLLEAKEANWSDNTTFSRAALIQELKYLFDVDISGLRGAAFIYEDFLKVALEKEKTTIPLHRVHEIWKKAIKDIQANQVLRKEYLKYTKAHFPERLEELIDSMEGILPVAENLNAVLSACKTD